MNTIKAKLLVSVFALALAVTLATTTTFAWFSMNSKVDVTDLNLNATTQGDLLISTAKDGTFGASMTFAAYKDKFLEPVTIKDANDTAEGILDTDGKLTFQSLDSLTDVSTHFYSMDIYFKSVSQYDVYIDQAKLAAADRTYNDPAQGLVTLDKAVNALYPYYTKGDKLFKVTDVKSETVTTGETSRVKFTKVRINDTEKDIKETGSGTTEDPYIYTYSDETNSVTLTFSIDDKDEVAINITGADKVINKDQKIDADAINALRIAIVDSTDTAKRKLTVFDPHSTDGWSKYKDFNMAHDYYDAVAASVGKESLDDAFKTEAVTPVANFDSSLLTLKEDGTVANGTEEGAEQIPVYTGHITIYMWLEGADADCLASIANSVITGSLSFRGVYLQK